MDKEFEKLEKAVKKIEELVDDFVGDELMQKVNKDNKTNIEQAKIDIIKELEKDVEAVIFATENRFVTVGKRNDVKALISCVLDSYKEKLGLDEMAYLLLVAFARNDKTGEFDESKRERLIKAIKEA